MSRREQLGHRGMVHPSVARLRRVTVGRAVGTVMLTCLWGLKQLWIQANTLGQPGLSCRLSRMLEPLCSPVQPV